jgi:hypothetical protein
MNAGPRSAGLCVVSEEIFSHPGDLMLRKAFMAAAAVSSLLVTDIALAQDGGIWASRPRPRRIIKHTAPVNPLQGLTNGQLVRTSGGANLGTISQIVTGADGAISQVIVTSTNGQTYRLAPASLSISSGVVTTSDTNAGT